MQRKERRSAHLYAVIVNNFFLSFFCSRHWQELGFLIIYVTSRPDFQKIKVMSWLAEHNFPYGLVSFCCGISKDIQRHKTEFLRYLVSDVSNRYERNEANAVATVLIMMMSMMMMMTTTISGLFSVISETIDQIESSQIDVCSFLTSGQNWRTRRKTSRNRIEKQINSIHR